MLRLNDHRDLLHLGQCNLDLYYMSLDASLWERLAQTHFTEKQLLSVMSEEDFGEGTDWCSVHQKCYKYVKVFYPSPYFKTHFCIYSAISDKFPYLMQIMHAMIRYRLMDKAVPEHGLHCLHMRLLQAASY